MSCPRNPLSENDLEYCGLFTASKCERCFSTLLSAVAVSGDVRQLLYERCTNDENCRVLRDEDRASRTKAALNMACQGHSSSHRQRLDHKCYSLSPGIAFSQLPGGHSLTRSARTQ